MAWSPRTALCCLSPDNTEIEHFWLEWQTKRALLDHASNDIDMVLLQPTRGERLQPKELRRNIGMVRKSVTSCSGDFCDVAIATVSYCCMYAYATNKISLCAGNLCEDMVWSEYSGFEDMPTPPRAPLHWRGWELVKYHWHHMQHQTHRQAHPTHLAHPDRRQQVHLQA